MNILKEFFDILSENLSQSCQKLGTPNFLSTNVDQIFLIMSMLKNDYRDVEK